MSSNELETNFNKFIKDQNLCQKSKKEQMEIINSLSDNKDIRNLIETLINIESCKNNINHPIPSSK